MFEQFYVNSQSWCYTEVGQIGKRVVRVLIRANSHPDQCSQEIALFDGDKWNQILWFPMRVIEGLHHGRELKNVEKQIFRDAAQQLKLRVREILTVKH